ncbi:MAG: 2-succinyl-5-enolpyruvyl-6-hydroxy-3-cyclohexene-1-carboxylic-acid synthase [Acidimicrobiales bacterium]|nr:2-succinyl-5-enolpyruvyl-6-hydroxy-3-cyclohexene-1-carboxylic-acid synthase [Acidimicrobiales bacterium]MDG1844847.1 2-succinyl-5-enolpyruvyl-6-hydroxy-3-cyclohexene-1-carboxylic-acid synthase [Acidimicrobiales bacterium]
MSKSVTTNPNTPNELMYAFCLRFFSEMRALGVADVIISPGSRSTPLALSAQAVGFHISVHLDERVAGFHALGSAKVTGIPVILICSSGTAAANYHPAVIEANHAQVPMIICTADRPPELRQWGAGQTIDQVGIYKENIRWGWDLPVVSEVDEDVARSTALRAWSMATAHPLGPVHLNWPLREPLEPSRELDPPEPTLTLASFPLKKVKGDPLLSNLSRKHERGLIVVGPNDYTDEDIEAVLAFSSDSGWPILADPCSQMRGTDKYMKAPIITSGEILLASDRFTSELASVDVVVHIGLSATSKAFRLWQQRYPPDRFVLVSPGTDWADPLHGVTDIIHGAPRETFRSFEHGRGIESDWCQFWVKYNDLAKETIRTHVEAGDCELSFIAQVLSCLPDKATLVLSNSMIVRDAELAFQESRKDITVISNRGANGIDGVISTAIGAASSAEGPCLLLIGDIAAVHDISGLLAAGRLQSDLVIIVIDNGGGAIFSFLPISQKIDNRTFADLFTVPHGTSLNQIGEAAGLSTATIGSLPEIEQHLDQAFNNGGPWLFSFQTTVDETVAAFSAIRSDFESSVFGR